MICIGKTKSTSEKGLLQQRQQRGCQKFAQLMRKNDDFCGAARPTRASVNICLASSMKRREMTKFEALWRTSATTLRGHFFHLKF